MPPIAADPVETAVAPGYRGLLRFCRLIGEDLEPHERRIARVHFGDEREVYAVLPRGNLKTTLAAKVGVHHLLTVPGASVTIGAASRDQARICFERMRGFAQHPALEDRLTVRHLELRHEDDGGELRLLRVIPSDGPRAHGLSSTLYIGDELWAWEGEELLAAMLTGLVKNPEARFLGISTAAARLDTPLGRVRARALAGKVTRKGAVIDAAAPGLRWLEWSLREDRSVDDFRAVKSCNPARYITIAALREQARRVTPLDFAQFHCCRWGVEEGSWLPAGAWTACAGDWAPADAPVVLFVDVGGSRASTALVGVTRELQVAEVRILQGDEAVLAIVDEIVEIARRRPVLELAHDPWRFRSEALRLERDHGLWVVEVPMSQPRLVAMSEGLHSAVVSKRLTHPGHPGLDRQIAAAVARQTPRGWLLDKSSDRDQIDAAVALAGAVMRAQSQPEPVIQIGWI
jgi:phage terminase large subunit-like protein